MTSGEAGHPVTRQYADERGAQLALLPVASTILFYTLPDRLQNEPLIEFAPQIIAYLALVVWASQNHSIVFRLGLEPKGLLGGLKIGVITGVLLGGFNTLVILRLVPSAGYDIAFLQHTPHARLPLPVMVPWFILGIALFVEINFRGFLLARLVALEAAIWNRRTFRRLSPLALSVSALVFAFDPFMVKTFQHLHWIAVWDGLIWAFIRLRTGNLYATILAHAIEVIIVYSAVRSVLMP